MKDNEYVLLKGNEAIAHAAIRCGCDGFFGYPITPQSEILETLSLLKPWETTGMVVLQAESEVARNCPDGCRYGRDPRFPDLCFDTGNHKGIAYGPVRR